jgi:murein DD-endopeptidase MepM/ murein hydrolase activator NlpD
MAAGAVQVVAAAPGVIVHREDGHPDQSCSFNGNRWNAVYVRQADGSIAWYGHLKLGSLTPKVVGDNVYAGEYLGLVGSSGNSTGPHLHFELHDAAWNRIDPYAGSCNPSTAASWWEIQPAYNDSAVLKVMTGSAPVDWADSCPAQDITHEQGVFKPGDRVVFTAFYRDQLAGQRAVYRVIRPDGSLYVEWDHASSAARYTLSYWWWAFDLSPAAPMGTWTFEVSFEGRTARQTFVLDGPATPTPAPTAAPTATPAPTPFPRELLSHWSFVPFARR